MHNAFTFLAERTLVKNLTIGISCHPSSVRLSVSPFVCPSRVYRG